MKHVYKKGNSQKTLITLHGTGGNEHDLIPIAEMIDPSANLLGIRGNVLENGMPRFFRRLSEGVFDEEDLVIRTKELYQFIKQASVDYQFKLENSVVIGYSNGANIAASILYHYNDSFQRAILFHAMVPLKNVELPNLKNHHVFIGAGENDPMIPKKETEILLADLKQANATIETFWTTSGHQLIREEVDAAQKWYEQF
ncbi:carboxylesterase [Bacillus sp. TS-2]|nr:carboxylesterase [Bacillus sp. TS-2]